MRKLKAFYWTLGCMTVMFIVAVLKGIQLNGDNLTTIYFCVTGVFVGFAGGNAAEWWANKGKGVPVQGEVKS